ncbi:MAG: amidohydrolase family protein, partial [Firmicutes bacterium]|nr:amidohydrolase family protein [Bacillota bacterium]
GAFPRLLAEFVRPGKLDLYKAVEMMTAAPAAKLGLVSKGRLNVGADADVVIFDLEKIKDGGTFGDPILPPAGIDSVFIGGEIAAKDCYVVQKNLGKVIRKF